MTEGIQVADLQTTGSFGNSASILLLSDIQNNTVNLIGKSSFIQSIVNSGTDNGIEVINNQLKVANIGNLADLNTTDKTSVVNAINEVKNETTPQISALATSGTVSLPDNSIRTIQPTASVNFTLPTVTDLTIFHQILIQMYLTDTSYIDVENGALGTDYYFNATVPTFSITGYYDLIYVFDNLKRKWCVGTVYKSEVS